MKRLLNKSSLGIKVENSLAVYVQGGKVSGYNSQAVAQHKGLIL